MADARRVRTFPSGVPSWIDTDPPDPEAAQHFYGRLFGWTFATVSHEGDDRYAFARLNGREVAGIAALRTGPTEWSTYIAVDDVDASAARIAAGGGEVSPSRPASARPDGWPSAAIRRGPPGGDLHRQPVHPARKRTMTGMTDFPQSHQDLLEAQVATLATIGSDGSPQQTEVWFLHEEGEVKLSLNTSRLKTRNLVKRPQCSLLILDLNNPYRYLVIRGTARVEPDNDYSFASKVDAKYGASVRDHDQPDDSRVVVTLDSARVYPVDMSG